MRSTAPDPDALDDRFVMSHRGPRSDLNPARPYAYVVEPERSRRGEVVDVATIFITNRECPFRCLMCDLWKNTTVEPVRDGAVADQIAWALDRLPQASDIKLYNSGNFFDARAIPRADHARIAELVEPFHTVIVECHPRLIDGRCLDFAERIRPSLEIAVGLETVDPFVLPRLNKRMTLAQFDQATRFLVDHGLSVRAFILLRPPFQSEPQGVEWAKRSLDHAFSLGVECCAIIPTRGGNGAMEQLAKGGHFAPPALRSLEEVLDYGVRLGCGRVFADLWDVETLCPCATCGPKRVERLRSINLTQETPPPVECACGL